MALVVIDMQNVNGAVGKPGVNALQDALPGVLALIAETKARRGVIFVMTLDGCGATTDDVLTAVHGYAGTVYVRKGKVDGSGSLLRAIKRSGATLDKLEFCGTWTSACVRETFLSMCEKLPLVEMELVSNACGDPWRHSDGLKGIRACSEKFRNAKVRRRTFRRG